VNRIGATRISRNSLPVITEAKAEAEATETVVVSSVTFGL
jgi:hypothetical protein